MLNNIKTTQEEIEPYEEFKRSEFFDIAYDMINYCEEYAPTILKFGNTNDIIEILANHIDFTNPFILIEDDDSEEDDEEYDELSN